MFHCKTVIETLFSQLEEAGLEAEYLINNKMGNIQYGPGNRGNYDRNYNRF